MEEDSRIQEIKEEIESFYSGAEIEILTADSLESCVKEYQETIARMEQMGLKELEAYESQQYQEAKKKLKGIKR